MGAGCGKHNPVSPQVLPPPITSRTYDVKVLTPGSAPLADATVLLQTARQNYVMSTNSDGMARISLSNSVPLPPWVVIVATHATIMPEARTCPGGPGATASPVISTLPMPSTLLVRDVYLHHLGNDEYGGSANSQLQLPTEGISRSYSFILAGNPQAMPRIRLFARGVEHPTGVYINGTRVNTLAASPSDGSIASYAFRLSGSPTSLLHTGTNTLTIKTAPYQPSDPWDDIEYCGLMLYY